MPVWRLAIDFGTTSTAAAVAVEGRPEVLLQLEPDSNRMPSAVFLEKNGTLAAGRRAVNWATTDPSRFLAAPKRAVGQESVTLGGQRIATVQIVEAVLARVLHEAFRQRGEPPAEIILTHPARWGNIKTAVLEQAFTAAAEALPAVLGAAGLPAEIAAAAGRMPAPRLLAEPVAAASHYAQHYPLPAGAALAIYDLGGGTFDTAVVRHRDDDAGFDVLADGGLGDLGGENFDAALFTLAGQRLAQLSPGRWEAILEPGTDRTARTDQRHLLQYVQTAKEELSTSTQTVCRLLDDPPEETLFYQQDLNDLIRGDLQRSADELAATIESAGLTPASLAGTYLVGGSSRIPLVPALLARELGIQPELLDDPKAVVALGALTAPDDQPANDDNHRDNDASRPGSSTPQPRPALPTATRPARLKLQQLRFVQAKDGGLTRAAAVSDRADRAAILSKNKVTIIELPGGQLRNLRVKPTLVLRFGVRSMALSADGSAIATASGNVVQVWDAATGDLRQTVSYGPAASDAILNVDLCGDGQLVAALYDQVLCVWAVDTGRQLMIGELAARCGGSNAARCKFATSGLAIGVRLFRGVQAWNPLTGAQLLKRASIRLAISPDGSQAAVLESLPDSVYGGGYDLDFVDTRTGTVVTVERVPWAELEYSQDGQVLMAFGGSQTCLYHPPGDGLGAEITQIAHTTPGIRAGYGTLSADHRLLATTGNYAAQIWDVASGQLIGDIIDLPPVKPPDVVKVAFTPDGRRLATACANGVQLWDLAPA